MGDAEPGRHFFAFGRHPRLARTSIGPMKTSTQIVGVLVVMAAVFALNFVPMESTMRGLTAALVITVAGGTMAFLGRSRA